jgi:predicted transposase/invertase (TIGR01784 family)
MDIKEEEKFFSPQVDYLFKRVFGSEEAKEPLCSLLTAILHMNVSDVEIKNPDLVPVTAYDKHGIMDVRAIIGGREHVNVEIQVCYYENYMKRTQFYLSKLYESQLSAAQDYSHLTKAIVINILCKGKTHLPDEQWHNVYTFMERARHTPMPDGMLELHFIELDKMMKLGVLDETDLLTRWMLFMNAESMQDMKDVAKQEPAICKAYTIVEQFAKNKRDREIYEDRRKFLLDQISLERSAERRGKKEVARAMLADGIPIERVCKIAGLEVEDLKEE